MNSFEERFLSFKDWPRKFSLDFILKMCVIGQYSTSKTSLETACIYCKKHREEWDINDDPLTEHQRENCCIFRLHTRAGRDEFNKTCGFECSCKALCVQLGKGEKFVFCASCGRVAPDFDGSESMLIESFLLHKCCPCGTVRKFNKKARTHSFYINYLKGEYNTQIMKHIESEGYEIPEEKMDLVRFVIEKCRMNPLERADTVVEAGMSVLTRELEEEMKKLEETKKIEEN
ncbi:hypothetical protein NUSPORA_01310 [Nucleospora cyclopteri]